MPGLSDEQRQRTRQVLGHSVLIPVITIEQPDQALPLAQALVAGGIRVLEITLRTRHGLPAIRQLSQELPEDVLVGAGTVTGPAEYRQAESAGARFVVTPGITPRLLDYGLTAHAPLLPGITTVSELMMGYELGYRAFKFFPAVVTGGVQALEAFQGPFPEVVFCPTGGIRRESARDFVALPNVAAVGGTWFAPPELLENGDWPGVTRLARDSLRAVQP